MAPGTFALKLGEVIDDGHILKCATKKPKKTPQEKILIQDLE